jgi:hypothetical protein
LPAAGRQAVEEALQVGDDRLVVGGESDKDICAFGDGDGFSLLREVAVTGTVSAKRNKKADTWIVRKRVAA